MRVTCEQQHTCPNGHVYRIRSYGNGYCMQVDRYHSEHQWCEVAFWQGDDAEQPYQIWEENGNDALIRYAHDYAAELSAVCDAELSAIYDAEDYGR